MFHIVPKAKNYGYDIIEIAVEDFDIVDWGLLKKICEDNELEVSVSGAFGAERDISSEDACVRQNGIQYIQDCIDLCEKLNAGRFGGPMYSAVGKTRFLPPDEKLRERERSIKGLRVVDQAAKDAGILLGLEALNRFENDMINTVEQAMALIEEADTQNIKILIDTFHANIEEKSIPEAIRLTGKNLIQLHGNENDRGIPGTGHTDWRGIKNALEGIGFDGAIVVETFGAISKEIARAASVWRPLAESADILAINTIKYYKYMFKN
jgi:D-psicose/D-tagatose/L-ribulose 3-epimerase